MNRTLMLSCTSRLAAVAVFGLATACTDGGGSVGNPASTPEQVFASGVGHLENGEFEATRESFTTLLSEPEFECRAQYGIVLAGIQDAAARVGQIIVASALAGIRQALALDLEIDTQELATTLDTIMADVRGTAELQVNGPGNITVATVIRTLRALGAVPDRHPNLLNLADTERFAQIDNNLLTAVRAFFAREGDTVSGLLPSLLDAAASNDGVGNNFIGLVDANHDGAVDAGDSLVIGLRELHVTGLLQRARCRRRRLA